MTDDEALRVRVYRFLDTTVGPLPSIEETVAFVATERAAEARACAEYAEEEGQRTALGYVVKTAYMGIGDWCEQRAAQWEGK